MKGQKKIIKLLGFLGLILIFAYHLNCASRGRPGGGPPDTTPPLIIDTFPRPDSTGLKSLKEINIFFSERMNESSVDKSIFISPPLEYETDWSGGDELTFSLKDTLAKDQTYVLTIGSGAMDMQKNRMKDSYQFAFSTGAVLDRGEIFGRVFKIDPADIIYVYAYRETDPDSLDPTRVKADFLSQPGPDGSFLLRYLPYGNFRVFIIEDVNKNLILDTVTERVGIPTHDLSLDSTNNFLGPLNFILTKIDTTKPEISGARALNNRTVILRANEIIDDLISEIVNIQDTLTYRSLPVKGISRNREDEKQFFVYTAIQDSAMGYRLSVRQLADTSGNIQTEQQSIDFSGSYVTDTTKFEILKISPADSAGGVDLSAMVSLEFSLPPDTQQVSKNFNLLDIDSMKITGKWIWSDLQRGFFQPANDFKPGEVYLYSFTTKLLHSLWGDSLADTTYYRTFFMISQDEFGSMSGELQVNQLPGNDIYVQIRPLAAKKRIQTVVINTDKKFFVRWVPEGQYKIGGFIDLDENGTHSPGQLKPFIFSEPFTIQDDTLRVRKRWELSDLKLSIPEL